LRIGLSGLRDGTASDLPVPSRDGRIEIEGGTKQDVKKFFSYFDEPVDIGSINLIVR
jgi:hypothetical protein